MSRRIHETSVELLLKKSEPIEYTFQALDSLYVKGIEELERLCKLMADKSAGDEDSNESKMIRFNINIKSYTPIEHIQLVQDQDWLKQMNIPASEIKSIKLELSDSTRLFDENGEEITTLQLLLNSLVPDGMKEMPPTNITHAFDKPTFIETQDARISKLKIKGIRVSKRLAEIEMV